MHSGGAVTEFVGNTCRVLTFVSTERQVHAAQITRNRAGRNGVRVASVPKWNEGDHAQPFAAVCRRRSNRSGRLSCFDDDDHPRCRQRCGGGRRRRCGHRQWQWPRQRKRRWGGRKCRCRRQRKCFCGYWRHIRRRRGECRRLRGRVYGFRWCVGRSRSWPRKRSLRAVSGVRHGAFAEHGIELRRRQRIIDCGSDARRSDRRKQGGAARGAHRKRWRNRDQFAGQFVGFGVRMVEPRKRRLGNGIVTGGQRQPVIGLELFGHIAVSFRLTRALATSHARLAAGASGTEVYPPRFSFQASSRVALQSVAASRRGQT